MSFSAGGWKSGSGVWRICEEVDNILWFIDGNNVESSQNIEQLGYWELGLSENWHFCLKSDSLQAIFFRLYY